MIILYVFIFFSIIISFQLSKDYYKLFPVIYSLVVCFLSALSILLFFNIESAITDLDGVFFSFIFSMLVCIYDVFYLSYYFIMKYLKKTNNAELIATQSIIKSKTENLSTESNTIVDEKIEEKTTSDTKTKISSVANNKETQPYHFIPRWEEISEDERKIYIDDAIKDLFIKQLGDPYYEMDVKTLSERRLALQMNAFVYDSLTEEEKRLVNQSAKNTYIKNNYPSHEIGQSNSNSEKTNSNHASTKKGLSKLAKSMIIIPIVWLVLFIGLFIISSSIIPTNPSLAVTFGYLSILVYCLGGAVSLFETIGIIILIMRYIKRNR